MNSKNTQAPVKVEMVKVKLSKPHTHRCEDLERGNELELRKDQAESLIKQKRAVAL